MSLSLRLSVLLLLILGPALLAAYLLFWQPTAYGAAILVNTAADETNPNDGSCSLREAINSANTNSTPDPTCVAGDPSGTDVISFQIPGGPAPANPVINLTTSLPAITSPMTINGATTVSPGVVLDGGGVANNGFAVNGGSGVTIKNLVIEKFNDAGIYVASGDNNYVLGNYIGTDKNGTGLTFGNAGAGVQIDTGSGNVIGGVNWTPGGACTGECNVISGNNNHGIELTPNGASDTQVLGNYIGTDAQGLSAIPNFPNGIDVSQFATGTIIGGASVQVKNVIAGNNSDGIDSSAPITVDGNYIGTTRDGTSALANGDDGIYLETASNGSRIGTGAPNVVSGNTGDGILVESNDNEIKGNYMGLNAAGTSAIPNGNKGVSVRGIGNAIGGTGAGEGNVISGNGEDGLVLEFAGTMNNNIRGNKIGTQFNGTGALGNGGDGVLIRNGAHNNTIGGTDPGEGNIVANNGANGVHADGGATQDDYIRANSIYANADKGIELTNGANDGISPPVMTSAGPPVTGTSLGCLSCIIDIFSDQDDQGQVYLGTTTVDGTGNWTFSGFVTGPNLTATRTNYSGGEGTSPFSSPVAAPVQTPTPSPSHTPTATPTHSTTPTTTEGSTPTTTHTPTPTGAVTPTPTVAPTPTPTATPGTPTPTRSPGGPLQGDVDCNGHVDSVDALKLLRHVASLTVQQAEGCPQIGSEVASLFGDVDCEGQVNAVDALKVLRFVAGLPVQQNDACAQIGTTLD